MNLYDIDERFQYQLDSIRATAYHPATPFDTVSPTLETNPIQVTCIPFLPGQVL